MLKKTTSYCLTLLFLFSAYFSIYSSSLMACYGCHGYRSRTGSRACFANMKTIAGAIEMFNLDFNVDIKEITPSLIERFVKEGYLQSIPLDPGFGSTASSAYLLTNDGLMCCINHGFIQPPEGLNRNASAFDQLKASGETREQILARASHKPCNTLSSVRKLEYTTAITADFLWSTGILLFLVWFPLSIWRLRKQRFGQEAKLACLIIAMAALVPGLRHFPPTLLLILFLTPVVLLLDMVIFAIRLLSSKELVAKMAEQVKSNAKVHTILSNSYTLYHKSARILKAIAVLALLPAIPWIFQRSYNFELSLIFLMLATAFFIIGAVTGTVRFSNSIRAANSSSRSDGTIPLVRTILTAILFIVPLLQCGRFIVYASLTYWAPAAWPLLLLTSFFSGRFTTVAMLSNRFIGLLKKTTNLPTPLKKHIRTAGISAHPGRIICTTSNKVRSTGNGTQLSTETYTASLPMPEAKLSLGEATCPVCGEGFPDYEAWLCKDCNTPHHSDCWKFNGTCTTFGCNGQKVSLHYF